MDFDIHGESWNQSHMNIKGQLFIPMHSHSHKFLFPTLSSLMPTVHLHLYFNLYNSKIELQIVPLKPVAFPISLMAILSLVSQARILTFFLALILQIQSVRKSHCFFNQHTVIL